MKTMQKLFLTAVGFFCLLLCGAAFAEPSLDRFIVSLEAETAGEAYAPLTESQAYSPNRGTADAPDTWRLRYTPTANGRSAFRIGVAASGFDADAAFCELYQPAGQALVTNCSHKADSSGNFLDTDDSLVPVEFLQTSPTEHGGVFTMTIEGVLAGTNHNPLGAAAVRYLQITFVPERSSLTLGSGTEGVVFAPSNADGVDYECTLPVGTRSLNVNAVLGGTIASALTWSDANVPSTLVFARGSDNVLFGSPATFSNTVTFNSSPAGTAARVEVTLKEAPDGSGGLSTLKKVLKVNFDDGDFSLALSPTLLAGVTGTAMNETIALGATAGEGNILSDVSVSPSSWNGLSLTASGGEIRVGGVPSAKGEKTFVVTALVNGSPRAATFAISIGDSDASLVLSESRIEGYVGVPLLRTVTASGTGAGDVLGVITVAPTEWNGLAVSVFGDTITLNGTPTLSGSGKFTVSVPVNGVVRSADFVVSAAINALSPLKLSPGTVAATVGKNLSATVITHSDASGDVIARVAVSPANWNGLTALVSDTKILLSGVPEGAGSQTFAVTAVVNAGTCGASFRVDVSAEGENPDGGADDTLPISAMPEDWKASYSEATRVFSLSTTLSFPAEVLRQTVRAATVADVDAGFRYSDAVESVTADVAGDRLSVGGRVRAGAKLNNVILDSVSVTFADGAAYKKGDLALMLTQVIRSNGGTVPDSAPSGGGNNGGGGGGGCNGGFGAPALLSILIFFSIGLHFRRTRP